MFITVTSIILFIALFIGLNMKRNSQRVYWHFQARSLLSVLAFLLILPACFAQVEANEVGIVYDPLSGGIQDTSLSEGLHFKTPFQQVKTISTKLRENQYTVSAQTGIILRELEDGTFEETGGGQFATYAVAIQYRVEVVNAHEFYRTFGEAEDVDSTVQSRIRKALQEKSVKYDIYSILKGELNTVRNDTEQDLIVSLQEIGITIESFIILDVDAGEVIEKVVEEEATAAKQKEIAIKEQEAELIRQETEKLTAEIIAEKVLIDAEANAEAQRVLNSVTANAIYTMYEGQFLNNDGVLDQVAKTDFELNGVGGYLTIQEISEIIVKQLYYDTWDGVLPTVVADENTDLIVAP